MAHHAKPGSKSERDALRHEMVTAGCTTAEIAVEMRARWTFRAREAWRHAHGWSQQQAADRINDIGRNRSDAIAADASLLGKWERWPLAAGRRPSDTALAIMAEVYGCAVEQLLDLEDRRALPAGTPARFHSAVKQEAAARVTAAPTSTLSAPTAASSVQQAAAESAAWALWAETTNLGEVALEQINADVRRLSADYLNGDAISVFTRTRNLRDTIFRLLEGHQSPRQARDLYVAAGYSCALLAWMSSDLGHLADADTHGRTAWLCGEKAEHPGLLAWTASTRAKVAFWDGRLRDAVNYARRGAAYAPTGTVSALLACQEADAWSRLGAADETRDALHRATVARDDERGEDDIGGLFSCSIGRQEQYAAGAHLRIGMYHEALSEADTALAHLQSQPLRAYGTEAQTGISQAMAHVGLGQPEAVLDILAPVLALRPEQRLDTVVGRMRDLTSMMTVASGARGTASVQTRGALTDWSQDSAPRRLALSPGAGAA